MSLKELRIACSQRDIPIISVATEQFLRKILQKYKPKTCIEIGGAVGYSGIFMAEIIKQRGGNLYSFEISYPGYREGCYNKNSHQTYNLVSYPCNVLHVALEKFVPRNPVDFVFVDAQKSEYGAYLAKIENIIDKKTVIIIDDVIKYHHKLVSLYGYLEKKQIKCVRTSKRGEKRTSFGGENDTGDLSFIPQDKRNRKNKGKAAISDFENNRVYKIMQLDPDDGVMIIYSTTKGICETEFLWMRELCEAT